MEPKLPIGPEPPRKSQEAEAEIPETLIVDKDLAHEIALEADPAISATVDPLGKAPTDAERTRRQSGINFQTDVAELKLKHQAAITDNPALARGAVTMLAPEVWAERRRYEKEAYTDALTGLPNRRAFQQALPEAEADEDTEIIIFDGDNFGSINKDPSYGDVAGDAAIIELARVVRAAADRHGVSARRVFRPHGDSIYVLAPHGTATAIIADAEELLRQRFTQTEEPLRAPAGEGREKEFPIAEYPKFQQLGVTGSFAQTYTEAERRMYQAKQAKKAAQARQQVDQAAAELSSEGEAPKPHAGDAQLP